MRREARETEKKEKEGEKEKSRNAADRLLSPLDGNRSCQLSSV
jgi:hypothetical protein